MKQILGNCTGTKVTYYICYSKSLLSAGRSPRIYKQKNHWLHSRYPNIDDSKKYVNPKQLPTPTMELSWFRSIYIVGSNYSTVKSFLISSSHSHLRLHLYFATKFLTAIHINPYGLQVLLIKYLNITIYPLRRRSRLPCGLRRRPAAALMPRSRFRILLGAWTSVPCVCCVLCR